MRVEADTPVAQRASACRCRDATMNLVACQQQLNFAAIVGRPAVVVAVRHEDPAASFGHVVVVAEGLGRCGLLEVHVQEACVGDCRFVAEDEVAPPRLRVEELLYRGQGGRGVVQFWGNYSALGIVGFILAFILGYGLLRNLRKGDHDDWKGWKS